MIFVDLDGVLVDFIGGVADRFGTTEADLLSRWEPGVFDCWPALGLRSDQEMWDRLNERPGFFESLPAYRWADELLRLVARTQEGWMIASAPSRVAASASEKVRWLHDYFGHGRLGHFGSDFRRYVLTAHKSLLAGPGRLLIDDSDDNCRKFVEAGGEAILFPRHWNRRHQHHADPMPQVMTDLLVWEWGPSRHLHPLYLESTWASLKR